jgi:hypothetical protein
MRTVLQMFLLLVVIAGGVAGGLYVRGWLDGGIVPENSTGTFQSAGPEAGQPTSLPGWCCTTPGANCTQAPDPVRCLQGNGRLFNIKQQTCNAICASLAQ